ncbi:hypothetical protein VaNZ11_015757 [Volvox africanus]|uniref:Uncharacterized protein n=1 Tax=Volvox africanus TaxID=51714 RepID=A0ABQ5SMV2_9CHLO|nr:hypothetical protein VaNZ11_015757 [Volvox africanus]
MVVRGEFRRPVTPNITVRHIDLGQHPCNDLMGILEDLYLLSRAKCIMTMDSGCSNMAVWMSAGDRLTCHDNMYNCTASRPVATRDTTGSNCYTCYMHAVCVRVTWSGV